MPLGPIDPNKGERQTLDEIREWHLGIVAAIMDQRASILHAIRDGSAVAPRFAAMTESEVDNYYEMQRRELDWLTILDLVASTEASVKDDFFYRVKRNLKDSLSRAYGEWYRKLRGPKRLRPDFDEKGILDVLKDARVMDNHIVGEYRVCLRLRHWIGHGRNWDKPKEVGRLDPDDVYDRCNALLRTMPMP